MGLIDQRAAQVDSADLVILAHVETLRGQNLPATSSAIASLIGGATGGAISSRMARLAKLRLVEANLGPGVSWQLTQLGAEVMDREVIGWSPSKREQERRDAYLRSAIVGSMRS
jgi:hypothetical protein